jgi:hypothetical protein
MLQTVLVFSSHCFCYRSLNVKVFIIFILVYLRPSFLSIVWSVIYFRCGSLISLFCHISSVFFNYSASGLRSSFLVLLSYTFVQCCRVFGCLLIWLNTIPSNSSSHLILLATLYNIWWTIRWIEPMLCHKSCRFHKLLWLIQHLLNNRIFSHIRGHRHRNMSWPLW